jgi:hypothetical protein
VTTTDVQPEALLEAARVLYCAVRPSWFETKATANVGPRVSEACDAFVQRLERVGITKELIGLAKALEFASGHYVSTDTGVAQKATSRGD